MLLPQQWHVIAPDWRGFGQSQWNRESYYFPDYLADLDALLDHYQPDGAARLVGHSLGGIVASLYAGARPQRVAKLISIEGFGLAATQREMAPDRLRRWWMRTAGNMIFPPIPDWTLSPRGSVKSNPRLSADRRHFGAMGCRGQRCRGQIPFDPRHRWSILIPVPAGRSQRRSGVR